MITSFTLSMLIIISGINNIYAVPEENIQYLKDLAETFYKSHNDYKEETIITRRFKHIDIIPLIMELKGVEHFTVRKEGISTEGKEIFLVSYGHGPVDVLLWSQMHGDESTATMAILDIFNLLKEESAFPEWKDHIRERLTLHFIPMLNPDGAERFQRRNANGVDLNRDALRLQNPESKILKSVRDSLNADWGFNLHDQNRWYGAGLLNPHTAAISFLAPAYNYEKEVNGVRMRAMQLIGDMNVVLQEYIPGKVAKYNDDFEPRAFGDNIQKWGTSTILIESGGLIGDREKQELRKMNYVALLTAFESIAEGVYKKRSRKDYENIPFNNSNVFHDLLVRKATVENEGQSFILDIAWRLDEREFNEEGEYSMTGSISDIGDLSILYGYGEFDAEGYDVSLGKTYDEKVFNDLEELLDYGIVRILESGATDVYVRDPPGFHKTKDFPLRIIDFSWKQDDAIDIGHNPALVFKKGGMVEAVVVNGTLHMLDEIDPDLWR